MLLRPRERELPSVVLLRRSSILLEWWWKPCPVHPCRHNFNAVKEQRSQAKSLKDEGDHVDPEKHLTRKEKAKCLCAWQAQIDEHPEFKYIEEETDPFGREWPFRHLS